MTAELSSTPNTHHYKTERSSQWKRGVICEKEKSLLFSIVLIPMFSKGRARRRLFENQLKVKGEAMTITCTRFFFSFLHFFPARNVQHGEVHTAQSGYRLYFPKVSICCYSTIDLRTAPRPLSFHLFSCLIVVYRVFYMRNHQFKRKQMQSKR